MIKKLILPLLLSFGMVSALAMNPVTVHAEEDSGIVTSKTVDYDEKDGSYTITLEAYATGEVTTSTVTKEVPTDIILVLDLSSSMNQTMNTVSYTEYSGKTNEDLYALRHNGGEENLWYQIPGTTKYASVSVVVENRNADYTDASSYSNSELWENYNNLYAEIGNEYVKVTVSRNGGDYTYTYTYSGQEVTVTSRRGSGNPNFGSGVSLWVLCSVDSTNATYTYSYTDSTETKTIVTSTGGSETPETVFYFQSTTPGTTTRLAALQAACTSFANAVAEKAAASEGKEAVKHRIAVVGFNSNAFLYIGSSRSDAYTSAFQDMSTDKGKNNVLASINALGTLGTSTGTKADAGMGLANTIFSDNPVPLEGETARNRVVVFFTDGAPGTGGSDKFDKTVANKTITAAGTARDSYGATVYSVAVVDGADPTKAGVEPQEESGTVSADKINWYLQNVSNNMGTPPAAGKPSYYLAAADADSLKDIFGKIAEESSKGGSTSKLDSSAVIKDIMSPYFTLPAGAEASDISVRTYKCIDDKDSSTGFGFEETSSGDGGATARIDEDGNVSVTGFDFSENWCGLERSEAGFQKVREGGYKLVISFKVQPKEGFLGGNNVPTNNGEGSGVYENADAETPVEYFTVPKANVTIKGVTTTAEDKNVYLLRSVTKEELQSGATVTVGADAEGKGGIKLDLSKAGDTEQPYGLEKWQSEYVNIKVTIKDKDGKEIPAAGLQNLKEDSEYSIEVKIEPKETADTDSVGPNVEARTGEDTADINVFKPQLTFKDGNAYYGEKAWNDTQYGTNCKTAEKWLHVVADGSSTEDTAVAMLGTKPTLTIAYTPDATKLYDDAGTQKFGKADVPVKAETKIDAEDVTKYTTFVHTPCPEDSGYSWTKPTTPGDPAFLIHIKTCKLTVTKAGDSTLDNGSYVFTVRKAGQPYSEVSIQGNGSQTLCELPVGTYSIEENTGWSWRYSAGPDYSVDAVLSSQEPAGTISCTNTRVKDTWLDGYSAIVRNVFGIGSSSAADSDTH